MSDTAELSEFLHDGEKWDICDHAGKWFVRGFGHHHLNLTCPEGWWRVRGLLPPNKGGGFQRYSGPNPFENKGIGMKEITGLDKIDLEQEFTILLIDEQVQTVLGWKPAGANATP